MIAPQDESGRRIISPRCGLEILVDSVPGPLAQAITSRALGAFIRSLTRVVLT